MLKFDTTAAAAFVTLHDIDVASLMWSGTEVAEVSVLQRNGGRYQDSANVILWLYQSMYIYASDTGKRPGTAVHF